jgi:hypothetical protein
MNVLKVLKFLALQLKCLNTGKSYKGYTFLN